MTSAPRHRAVTGVGVVSALVPMVSVLAALIIGNLLVLDYVHVLLGAIWTGVDVFFGVIFRSVFKELTPETRASVAYRVMPATLFFTPAASILTPVAGYFLAVRENLWNLSSGLFILIIIIGTLLVASGFFTMFLSSLLIVHSGTTSDSVLRKRFGRICNGALLQLFFQIALISLMADLVVFH